MTQNNLYMEDDDMRLFIDVQPLFIDELENCKNAAAASASQAAQSEQNAGTWKNDIIEYKTNLELFYAQASDGIINQYNNSVSDLTAAKNSALDNLQTQRNTIINSLNNSLNTAINSIRTNGQSYVNQAQYYAQDAQSTVDNRVSKDHLNQSKALLTGSVSADSDVLADVTNYAHSTYCGDQASNASPLDPKKFVYSAGYRPAITNDGIASGFSSTSYLSLASSASPTKSLVIYSPKFKISQFGTTESVFKVGDNTDFMFAATFTSTGVLVAVVKVVNSENLIRYADTPPALNTYYQFKCVWDGASYALYISVNGGEFISAGSPVASNISPAWASGYCLIGTNGEFPAYHCTIDLKQFSITVDGVPVFSGNKTGVDTVKANNFEAPSGGSLPTISADGIASGFSSTSYLTAPNVVIDTTKPFKCCLELTTGTLSAQAIVSFDSNWYATFTSNKYLSWRPTSNQNNWMQTNEALEDNTKYYIEFGYDGTDVFINYQKEDGNLVPKSITPANYTGVNNLSVSTIGCFSTLVFNGSIDLNSFKIYVDGDLVYQPLLRIPYTESKTGSKIVNSIYRDRVNDMASQFGYAPYYTLSDIDFTLPMGEIYGMIENLRKLIMERTA